jgi:hypothetical protein
MKGGFAIVPEFLVDLVNAAIVNFQQEVSDKKAMVLPTTNIVDNLVRIPARITHCRLLPLMCQMLCAGFYGAVDVL